VIDLFLLDQIEHQIGADLAQADIGADRGGDGPREAPAVAVKHRQGPQIGRMQAHVPHHGVADRVQIRAAMVVDHPFGIAGRAGGVVEGNRLPLTGRILPGKLGIAFSQQRS
jgi:hypothetical protein